MSAFSTLFAGGVIVLTAFTVWLIATVAASFFRSPRGRNEDRPIPRPTREFVEDAAAPFDGNRIRIADGEGEAIAQPSALRRRPK